MLTARRISYSGASLPGVDVRDGEGKLIASCYGHGQQGERVLRALLEAFTGEEVVVSYISLGSLKRERISEAAAE